jgi:hypothetical protein
MYRGHQGHAYKKKVELTLSSATEVRTAQEQALEFLSTVESFARILVPKQFKF